MRFRMFLVALVGGSLSSLFGDLLLYLLVSLVFCVLWWFLMCWDMQLDFQKNILVVSSVFGGY